MNIYLPLLLIDGPLSPSTTPTASPSILELLVRGRECSVRHFATRGMYCRDCHLGRVVDVPQLKELHGFCLADAMASLHSLIVLSLHLIVIEDNYPSRSVDGVPHAHERQRRNQYPSVSCTLRHIFVIHFLATECVDDCLMLANCCALEHHDSFNMRENPLKTISTAETRLLGYTRILSSSQSELGPS
jgi:hypothetical protein